MRSQIISLQSGIAYVSYFSTYGSFSSFFIISSLSFQYNYFYRQRLARSCCYLRLVITLLSAGHFISVLLMRSMVTSGNLSSLFVSDVVHDHPGICSDDKWQEYSQRREKDHFNHTCGCAATKTYTTAWLASVRWIIIIPSILALCLICQLK